MRLLVGTRKGLMEWALPEAPWGDETAAPSIARQSFLGDPVTAVAADTRDGALYCALNLGHFGVKVHRREPGADAFTEIAAPSFPPKPEAATDDSNPWSLQLIWSLVPGAANQPGTLWAGTIPGGLFVSRDRGTSWQLNAPLWNDSRRKQWMGGGYDHAGIHSLLRDPRDPRRWVLGISSGGVWHTEDDGQTWALSAKGMVADYMPPELAYDENTQDPHLLARCTGQPDVLWCQHHGGQYRSTDGGRNWQRLTNTPVSDFGFAVAAHPMDGNTAWFVPGVKDACRIPVDGALCVLRTRDGGKHFEALRTGLPQRGCFDLIYRHGLAVSSDGRTLAMGSTTGNLWCSFDGGEHWATLSTHLPPIACVALVD